MPVGFKGSNGQFPVGHPAGFASQSVNREFLVGGLEHVRSTFVNEILHPMTH